MAPAATTTASAAASAAGTGSATTSAASPASTASAATVATAISTTVSAAIVTLALRCPRAVVAARRVTASGIVVGGKILRRRSVGVGLAVVHLVMLGLFAGRWLRLGAIAVFSFLVVLAVRFAGGFIEVQNFFTHADGFA